MEMLSKKVLTDYMLERTLQHLSSRLYGNLSERRKKQIEKQKQHMSQAHDKIQRQEG